MRLEKAIFRKDQITQINIVDATTLKSIRELMRLYDLEEGEKEPKIEAEADLGLFQME